MAALSSSSRESSFWETLTPYSESELYESEIMADASATVSKRAHDDTVQEFPNKRIKAENVHIIAHDSLIHDPISKLPYGTQYLLAYYISSGQLSVSKLMNGFLNELQGSSVQANEQLSKLFKRDDIRSSSPLEEQMFAQEFATNSPWQELDKEEEVLARHPFAGLGNHSDYPGWYGGKVAFRGKVAKDGDRSYRVVLDDVALGSSCRFARRFGSKSLIRIKVPDSIFYDSNNSLNEFFQNSFIIWNHVFQTLYAKDNNVFLVRVDCEMLPDRSIHKVPGTSWEEYLAWFNPLDKNMKQPVSKWAARFALGFSNSVPGPSICTENILVEDDVVSAEGSEMTDGCGFCNFKLLAHIREHFELEKIPTAIQFRLGGYKGMLILRVDDDHVTTAEDPFKIWVRPSQTKIRGQPSDPGHNTLDLLRTSYIRTPSQISPETIINISENSFSRTENPVHQALPELMEKALTEMVESLTVWEGEDAMYRLWANVDRAGGVSSMRRAREIVGQQRFKGLGYKDYEDEDEDEDDKQIDKESDGDLDSMRGKRSTAWWPDQVSGCPSSLEETVMYLLDGGFTPQKCPILREKLQKVVETKIESKIEKMKIVVTHSATAFAIPDPFGVLEPDEIQLKSTNYNLKMPNGTMSNMVLGDVLVGRNPCKVPSDMRKVKAVEHPRLYKYTDVIVCPIKGKRRFIDYLAGGDYDGDTLLTIWEPSLVDPFSNADERFSLEPEAVNPNSEKSCFLAPKETVAEFLECLKQLTSAEGRRAEVQKHLLGALRGTQLVGKYSVLHDNAVYKHGYSSPQAVLLAYKFCKVLDGPKSGLRLKDGVMKQDLRDFGGNTIGPAWKDPKRKKNAGPSNLTYLQRSATGYIRGAFIMDRMQEASKDLSASLFRRTQELFAPLGWEEIHDRDLERPWVEECERVERELKEAKEVSITKADSDAAAAAVPLHSSAGSSSSSSTITADSSNNTLAGSSATITTTDTTSIKLVIAQAKERDLERIRQHVIRCYKLHENTVKALASSKRHRESLTKRRSSGTHRDEGGGGDSSNIGVIEGGADFTNLPITRRQDILRKVSKEFHEGPKPEEMQVYTSEMEIARLRASFAFIYDLECNKRRRKWSRFPFDVAARELCAIKASAAGPWKTVKGSFYEKFKMAKMI
ncbi:RNA dependent RNA polymerase domain containing protein [Amanita muscaria]